MYPLMSRLILCVVVTAQIVAAVLLLGAAPALAAVSVDLVWTGTTGSGTAGGSSIEAEPGD